MGPDPQILKYKINFLKTEYNFKKLVLQNCKSIYLFLFIKIYKTKK